MANDLQHHSLRLLEVAGLLVIPTFVIAAEKFLGGHAVPVEELLAAFGFEALRIAHAMHTSMKVSDEKDRRKEIEAAKNRLVNEDLARAVGRTIQIIIIKEFGGKIRSKQWRMLADNAEECWIELARETKQAFLGPLAEPALVRAIKQNPRNPVFPPINDPALWRSLLSLLSERAARRDRERKRFWPSVVGIFGLPADRKQEPLDADPRFAQIIVACDKRFRAEFYDTLKHDFETGGRAFAGVTLRSLGESLFRLERLEKAERFTQKQLYEVIRLLREIGDKIIREKKDEAHFEYAVFAEDILSELDALSRGQTAIQAGIEKVDQGVEQIQSDLFLRNAPESVWSLREIRRHNLIQAPFKEVMSERPVLEILNFDEPALLFGNPNVGKTCEAVRQAYNWLIKLRGAGQAADAFLMHAERHGPDDISKIAKRVRHDSGADTPLLFIVDDIFRANAGKQHSIASAIRDCHCHVLWIARHGEAPEAIRPVNVLIEYSPRHVIERYARAIARLPEHARHPALIASGLDPRILKNLTDVPPQTSDMGVDAATGASIAVELIASRRTETAIRCIKDVRDMFARLDPEAGRAAFNAFCILLPAASLDCLLPLTFYEGLYDDFSIGIRTLVDEGLAVVQKSEFLDKSPFEGAQALLHPFLARPLLEQLTSQKEIARLAADLIGRYATKAGDGQGTHLDLTDVVLGRFVLDGESRACLNLEWLYDRSEWAGMPSTFLRAARFIRGCHERTPLPDELLHQVQKQFWKVERRVFRQNDLKRLTRLESLRHDLIQMREAARSAPGRTHRGSRLDTWTYELAYVVFLLGRIEDACTLMDEALVESVDAIHRRNGVGDADARMALAYFWVTAEVAGRFRWMRIFQEYIEGRDKPDCCSSFMNNRAILARAANLFFKANQTTGHEAAGLYRDAIRSVCPTSEISNDLDLFSIVYSNNPVVRGIANNETNMRNNQIESACWPAALGWTGLDPLDEPMLRAALKTRSITSSGGLPYVREVPITDLVLSLIHAALGDRESAFQTGVSAAAVNTALDNGEAMGFALLIAMLNAPSREASAGLHWYLKERCIAIGPTILARGLAQIDLQSAI